MQGVAVVKAIRCRLHSTLVVAGVEILWHASAHKRNPLFRRLAPALSTVRPEGSPGGSSCYRGKAPGDPSETKKTADQNVREIRAANESAFSSNQRNAGDGHTLQKDGACWVPRGREVCASAVVDTMGEVVEPRPILRSVAACVSRCVLRWPAGWAGCLCNRDSCGRTRKDQSCRCVDGWHCHTAGRRAPRVT